MRHLTTYKIFESIEWVSSIDEIREHFYDIEDDCKIDVKKFFISKDLEEFSNIERPGFYPGFVIILTPRFTNTDFDKYANYIKGISGINKRLPEYFEKYKILTEDQDSDDQPTRYRFVFLDTNYQSIVWDDDLIYKDNFMNKFGNLSLRYGTSKIRKHINTSTIEYQHVQPISKVKSNINTNMIKEYINNKFPDYNIHITENIESGLVTSISIACLGKKKS